MQLWPVGALIWTRRVRITMVSGADEGVSRDVARASDGRMPLRVGAAAGRGAGAAMTGR